MSPRRFQVPAAALFLVAALPLFGADGAALFKSKCVMCHGADGAATTAMGKKLGIRSFASAEVQKQADSVLIDVITKGKGKMPSYGGKLSSDEIKALVAHIRTFAK